MSEKLRNPDFIFEVSWEICNKVGGINTVIATKAPALSSKFDKNLVFIGPDIWRDTAERPDFEQDDNLFRSWREMAYREGLRLRIGRWKIANHPIAILIDYTPFFSQKNEIFKNYWEIYSLDSLKGPHVYVESAMFGYAAGRIIHSFWEHNLSVREKVVAHFHEWMSGAGVLYLKQNVPHIATLFTTHATVTGRSLAGNGYPLYQKLETYNGDAMSRELGIVSQQSMEKISAHQADAFTTVSEITAKECKQLLEREVDVVTPNGFDDSFVPSKESYPEKRKKAQKRIKEVSEALLGEAVPEDAMLIAISGRYEFRNKGIDIFINTLKALNENKNLKKEVIGFILVPANNYGPRKSLAEKLNNADAPDANKGFLTHGLHDENYDAIVNAVRHAGLGNKPGDKVKVIYVPSYLDGDDGIFNMSYYELLPGLDLTVFPSFYEPWGYTPLESLAFRVPTITTNLAGIGMWVNRQVVDTNEGIDVFDRKEQEDEKLVGQIVGRVVSLSGNDEKTNGKIRENAFRISRIALWKNLVHRYYQAYDIALCKLDNRQEQIAEYKPVEQKLSQTIHKSNRPVWKGLVVEANLPGPLKGLDEIAHNLWWVWNNEAIALFEEIDARLWKEKEMNPILLLKEVRYERLEELAQDKLFLKRFKSVYQHFKEYMAYKPDPEAPSLAYYSMEYGLHPILKIYSGGLGVLAGDYLKEASDIGYNMVAVGFLFRYGYFTQQLSVKGEQLVNYELQGISDLPVEPVKDENGEPVTVHVSFPGRDIAIRVWRTMVGRVPLYLLDTDFEENRPEDRNISHQLYGGDNEHRLKQEMILGIGGTRALYAMGITQELYHINEGHAALLGIERMRKYIVEKNYPFDEALEIVRASTLFTTHTPVPAGHDSFHKDLVMAYMGHYPDRLKTEFSRFMNLGRMHPGDKSEEFSMSVLAANTAQEVNGVSKLHGAVTRDMFNSLWEGYYPEELHVGHVTNGIHLNTWLDKDIKSFYKKHFPDKFMQEQSNKEVWRSIYKVDDAQLWDLRQKKRSELIDFVKERLNSHWINRHVNPRTIVQVRNNLDEKALTIGFARRFATYKRAHLLFRDIDRLARIVNNADMPVQFIFAGKAHPADGGGQGLIKHIVNLSNRPEFLGKIIFLENYDMHIAAKMVRGVDVWLNTPTRPLEASGTSGMKAIMNGVLNFSVLDGWWVEGYKEGAGWALPEEREYDNQEFQDELDSETIYGIFEQELIPMFYERNEKGVPGDWMKYVKKSIAEIAPEFTTKRMIDDYTDRFYSKLHARTLEIRKNDYELANRIANWKKKVLHGWESIVVREIYFPESTQTTMISGQEYKSRVVLDLKELADENIGVEILISEGEQEHTMAIIEKYEMQRVKKEGTIVTYETKIVPPRPGAFRYGVRIYPNHKDLPHRQDFPYVRWI